jgi:hypothetical protein
MADSDFEPSGDDHNSRLHLVWDVTVFQFKLAADGLRDLLLSSPLSIIAAILGLVRGGDAPDRYFRSLQRLGRRTDLWINLFGTHSRAGTSDELIRPLKDRVMSEAQANPILRKAGTRISKTLDGVNEVTPRIPGIIDPPE